jgi:hypothetical protein
LPQLFSDAREQVTELDDLIEGLVEDADFVEKLFCVRRINDRRGGKSQPETTACNTTGKRLSLHAEGA